MLATHKIIWPVLLWACSIVACSEGDSTATNHTDDQQEGAALQITPTHKVSVVAHRACWALAPENSLEAIRRCIELGVDVVEVDVRMSADGHLIVIHDDSVDRTTDGTGLVREKTLEELLQLRLKSGAGGRDARLTDERIPTLEDVLFETKGHVLVNLDVKEDLRDVAFQTVDRLDMEREVVFKMVASHPGEDGLLGSRFLEESIFMPILIESNGLLAEQVGRFQGIDVFAFELIYETEEQMIEACEVAGAQNTKCWVNTMWESLSPGRSEERHDLDADERWGFLIEQGVNIIQTDQPDRLIEYLSSKGLRD